MQRKILRGAQGTRAQNDLGPKGRLSDVQLLHSVATIPSLETNETVCGSRSLLSLLISSYENVLFWLRLVKERNARS